MNPLLWMEATAFAFVFVAGIALVCLAGAGALVALWLALPWARRRLEHLTVGEDQRIWDEAMARLDRTTVRRLVDLERRPTRVVDAISFVDLLY